MAKNFLVASVFCIYEEANTNKNWFWYNLQMSFLNQYIQSFDHIVYNAGENTNIFKHSKIIGSEKNKWTEIEIEGKKCSFSTHTYALDKIIDYFKNHEYDYYLILDSDCFPIKKIDTLINKIENKSYAAIIRPENLDTFPHPSAMLIKRNHLDKINFMPTSWITNLIGEEIIDTGCNLSLTDCYPLLRTNKWNPHPIFCGIYGDLFYHHCCGSTFKRTRASEYYGLDEEYNIRLEKQLFRLLEKNPQNFIEKLTKKYCIKI